MRRLHRYAAAYSAYAVDALVRLGVVSASLPTKLVLEAEWNECWESERARFKLYFLMREAAAPLVEALLVLDRALFVHEQLSATTSSSSSSSVENEEASAGRCSDTKPDDGCNATANAIGPASEPVVRIFPIFDPALSPRNLCIYASYRKHERPEL